MRKGNLSLHEAQAARRQQAVDREQEDDAQREARMAECAARTQAAQSEAFDTIRQYMERMRGIFTGLCEKTDPVKSPVALARAQGAIEFMDGMTAYFEDAERERAELEKQTAG